MLCHACLASAETRPVGLDYNIGLLWIRYEGGVRGELCKACIHKHFWKYLAINAFLGWWGLRSLPVTAFFLGRNLYRYLETLAMRAPEADPKKPALGEEDLDRLRPHLDYVLDRLQTDMESVASELARRAGVELEQAHLFVHLIRRTARVK